MNINDTFSSQYLRASDIKQRGSVTVTIKHCSLEDVGTPDKPEQKPVLGFEGAKKGLVLNKTNALSIAGLYGDETNNWIGKQIVLFTTVVSGPNGMTDGIRIQPPPGHTPNTRTQSAPAGTVGPEPSATPDEGEPFDDPLPDMGAGAADTGGAPGF